MDKQNAKLPTPIKEWKPLTEEEPYDKGYRDGVNAILKELMLLSRRLSEDEDIKNNKVYYELNKTIRGFLTKKELTKPKQHIIDMYKPIPEDIQEIINNNFWEML